MLNLNYILLHKPLAQLGCFSQMYQFKHCMHFFKRFSLKAFIFAVFSLKMAALQKHGRVESQLFDSIVSGYIKWLKIWTYKKVIDTAALRLECSQLTSAEGRKEKNSDLLFMLVRDERLDATQLLLTAKDVKQGSACLSFPLFLCATVFFNHGV